MFIVASAATDWIQACAVAVGVIVACLGLTTWRAQLVGTAQRDAARRFLLAAYRFREAIHLVRDPIMTAGEVYAAVDELGIELPPRAPGTIGLPDAGIRAAYVVRTRRLIEPRSALDLAALECEVDIGVDGRALSAPLRDCHGRIVVAIDTHLEAREVGPDGAGLTHRDLRPIRETVFGGGADRTDPFSVAVSAAVRAIEDAMVPHLGRARQRTGPTSPG